MEYRRDYTPGATYFFTTVTYQRKPILVDNIARLRTAFRYILRKRPFKLDAIVVLPDHIHSIWTLPQGDTAYSTRWSMLKRYFSLGIETAPRPRAGKSRREKTVWQSRFWEHRIKDESDWRAHLNYIHYNPVKHGYVDSPGDWPNSSFKHFVELGFYDNGWGASEPSGFDGIRAGE